MDDLEGWAGPATIRAALMVARSRAMADEVNEVNAPDPMRRPPVGLVRGGPPLPRRIGPRTNVPRRWPGRGKRR